MMLFDILPILIVFIVVALLFFLVMRSKSRNRKYMYTKRTYWMLGSYLMILLVVAGVYLTIPKQAHVHSEQIDQDNIPSLADLVYEGKSLADAHMYIQRQWELPYEQNQLQIAGSHQDYVDSNLLISVERKDENDGVIEVTHYETPVIVEGLDITEYMKTLQVDLLSTTLNIAGLERVEVKLDSFRNDFPLRQFLGENLWRDWDYVFGRQVLLLRIPKSLEIIGGDEYIDIHFVQE